MPMTINGSAQTSQQKRKLRLLENDLNGHVQAARQYTDSVKEAMRVATALNDQFGLYAELGAADPTEEFFEGGHTVKEIRDQIVGMVSFAFLRGLVSESDANGIIQTVTGDASAAVQDIPAIVDTVNSWV